MAINENFTFEREKDDFCSEWESSIKKIIIDFLSNYIISLMICLKR